MKPLLVSSGEPAGVGPDLCLALADHELPVVILGDKELLQLRAQELNLPLTFLNYQPHATLSMRRGHLTVLSVRCPAKVVPGKLNPQNSSYVIEMLTLAADKCLKGEFAGLVTAPVHKAVINQAGIPFTGHTEFLATHCNTSSVVMMLACPTMKVALVTTHLPLRAVADAISIPTVKQVIQQLNHTLKNDFNIVKPRLLVAGLNPHAGEGGYLGREEIDVITPALEQLREEGIHVYGPFPADTMFTPHNVERCDAFVAMYHDQGLSVLKYAGFGEAVNITLGLPFIRTSVDHGTALELAGTGKAEVGSLLAAVEMAHSMAIVREKV
ncbi:4-hydroxythreonine-4-phosphate dehydrogenase PdxA [Legionella jamestowniensis]|uniref:4-hydroxythreonine-4-phosphate dehydrogenase n=1 Tax=Legionella jamestowniensis TaxID=455 RepID=A0A0W0UK02_9GAMM|nr:4-hydroxythreonine-4-phosphate dehydrogenase PdxA [Legionella jamestowniensis]KTD07965.1 4-hydroxythreonine-4-phosphate dehydrogenase [Legionella jamestowniensis]SFL64764.1 4-hydroxythreonine-4-phosphate dehydrogenase [Legionella jamestowniensis DSM 19215]